MQMKSINDQVLGFRKFLLDSWGNLSGLMKDHDWDNDVEFMDDWLQVNWEFLVERELINGNGFLNTYGIYYKNPRITHPNAKITHLVLCKPKNGVNMIDIDQGLIIPEDEILIFHFLSKKLDETYGVYPPFDIVSLISRDAKKRFHVDINSANFYLCPIEDIKPLDSSDWFING